MELPELVGRDPDDMVRIAKRIGTDDAYRTELRAKIAQRRLTAPLFDTARFARDFETAIELLVQRHRDGLAPAHIDVPDRGPVPADHAAPDFIGRVSALQSAYSGCALCDGASVTLGFANCAAHPLWHEPLPTSIEWLRCTVCAHVHRRHYWTQAGLTEIALQRNANPAAKLDWTGTVEKAITLLGGYQALADNAVKPVWVDVGAGDGSLVMTASDYGFATIGLDTSAELVARIQQLGFNAMNQDFMKLRFDITPRVLSMMDVLQQLSHPREALRKAAQILPAGGVLIISTPDMQSSGWKLLDCANGNPFWTELEHHHNFARERLFALLRECGFDIVDFTVPTRNKAAMELYAVRRPHPVGPI
jgi:2-polyprenyl-3-methyl-5-hydroxy-6-metoxy-1,4-benzoquinol methylase